MLSSLYCAPNTQQRHCASKANADCVEDYCLNEFSAWHNGNREDGDDRDDITQTAVKFSDFRGLIPGHSNDGSDRAPRMLASCHLTISRRSIVT